VRCDLALEDRPDRLPEHFVVVGEEHSSRIPASRCGQPPDSPIIE
jgi:hypothetical protein